MRLIFDSGKMWSSTFFKNKKIEKGGGKGGADSYIWDAVMIMSKNWNMTSKTLIRASYYDIFDRNQHSERLPPFCPPFHFHTSRVGKAKFSTFSRSDPIFLGAQMALPPLLPPPFLNFWKVQNMIYKFCIYHLSSKCVVFALQTHVIKTNQPSYYDKSANM